MRSIFALVLVAAFAAAAPVPKALKKSNSQIHEVRWKITEAYHGATPYTDYHIGHVWRVGPDGKGEQTMPKGGSSPIGIDLDPTKLSEGLLDFDLGGTPFKGRYTLERGVLKLAFAQNTTPAEVVQSGTNNHWYFVFQREE